MKDRIEMVTEYIKEEDHCENRLYLNLLLNVAFIMSGGSYILDNFNGL